MVSKTIERSRRHRKDALPTFWSQQRVSTRNINPVWRDSANLHLPGIFGAINQPPLSRGDRTILSHTEGFIICHLLGGYNLPASSQERKGFKMQVAELRTPKTLSILSRSTDLNLSQIIKHGCASDNFTGGFKTELNNYLLKLVSWILKYVKAWT